MSALRARCPSCGTYTAVAVGLGYECHACGREYRAGLVRVPRAWGAGGEAMAEAASLAMPYPETAVVACETLEQQTATLAASLPARPLVLGGCCCAHTGAVAGLVPRYRRLGVVWFDAHGDLNTPETSPSGNAWGMPLRAIVDSVGVPVERIALVGARSLDPPEIAYMAQTGLDDDVGRALDGADAVYVALDLDVLDPSEVPVLVPEPGGPTLAELASQLTALSGAGVPVAGVGVTSLLPSADPERVTRLLAALGL